MAGGVISLCARALASALHRTAGVLDSLSARLSGEAVTDPVLAALAERYPGAPPHWLAYIAAHAPHLAGGEATAGGPAEAPGALPPAPASMPSLKTEPPPRRRAWLTFFAQDPERRDHPTARQVPRPPASERRFAMPSVDAERRAPQPGPDRPATRPKPRPRLAFASPETTSKAASASMPAPQIRRIPGELALVASSQPAAAEAPQPMAAAGETRDIPPPVLADPATPRSLAPHLSLSPIAGRRGTPGTLARWWGPHRRRVITSRFAAGPASRPAGPPLEDRPATIPFRKIRAVTFGHADADPALRRGFEADPWPTPPSWDAEIPDAPVGPADAGRLRAEQDDGAWNG